MTYTNEGDATLIDYLSAYDSSIFPNNVRYIEWKKVDKNCSKMLLM